MYLLYVDASGTPETSGPDKIYAMLGICVHEGAWFALQQQVHGLRSAYELPALPFELHAKDFCGSIDEQDEVPEL